MIGKAIERNFGRGGVGAGGGVEDAKSNLLLASYGLPEGTDVSQLSQAQIDALDNMPEAERAAFLEAHVDDLTK
jgi:hypothetical protein